MTTLTHYGFNRKSRDFLKGPLALIKKVDASIRVFFKQFLCSPASKRATSDNEVGVGVPIHLEYLVAFWKFAKFDENTT